MKFKRTLILYVITNYISAILLLHFLIIVLLDTSHVYSAFIFWLVVSPLIIYGDKRKQKKGYVKDKQNNYCKSSYSFAKPVVSTVIPNWTPDIIQTLDSKAFIRLIAEYFEIKGFLIKFPASIDRNMVDVFFLYTSKGVRFAIVKCRAIGGDLVSLETVKSFSDLSKQYNLINLALVTTGSFEDDPSGVIKNRAGFNLIGAPQLISMLTALPINKQAYLFTNMMLNKN